MTPGWPQPPALMPVIAHARLRVHAADFEVEEIAAWSPDGQGEHDVLWIEKTGSNTRWVADTLARHAGCRPQDVSYAGLKDRNAVTRQWFSVYRPGRQIDWSALQNDEFRILRVDAHGRKIRIGALAGNRFRLVLRDVCCDASTLSDRIALLRREGFPNYFGGQRFGRDGHNLTLAEALAAGRRLKRNQRAFALSAARAAIFNAVAAARVQRGDWCTPQPGDALMLAGSQSFFLADDDGELDTLRDRALQHDLHPTGPLWGRGRPPTGDAIARLEQASADELAACRDAAERGGCKQQRRALRCLVDDLAHTLDDGTLTLTFTLPAGSFATALINELVASPGDASMTE